MKISALLVNVQIRTEVIRAVKKLLSFGLKLIERQRLLSKQMVKVGCPLVFAGLCGTDHPRHRLCR